MNSWFQRQNVLAYGLVGLFALFMISNPAAATVYTWTGQGGNNLISNPGNWGGTAPNLAAGTDQAVFGTVAVGATTTVEIPDAEDAFGNGADAITFAAGAPAYTFTNSLSTNVLYIYRSTTSGAFNYVNNNSTSIQTFNVNVGVRRTIFNAASGDFVFNNQLFPGYLNNTSSSYWVAFEGAHDAYLNGNLVHSSAAEGNSRAKVFLDGGGGAVIAGDLGTSYNGKIFLEGEGSFDAFGTRGDGRLVATNNNSFAGAGGNTYILSHAPASQGPQAMSTARVEFTNNITVGETFGLQGRGGAAATAFHLLNTSGDNTIIGNIINSSTTATELGNATPLDQTEYNIGSNGGSLTIAGTITQGLAAGARNLNLGGTSTGTITADNTIAGVIQQAAGAPAWNLVKKDAGKWVLAAANTYTGTTTITGGTLVLGSTGSIGSSPTINVASGTFDVSAVSGGFILGGTQTLKGAGAVTGAVTTTSGSIIAPGSSAGTLTLNGPLTLVSGSTLQYELSNNLSSGNDRIQLNSDLTLSGTVNLPVTMLNGSLATGTYRLMDYTGALTGNAGNFALSGLGSGGTRQNFNLLTGNDVGGTANQINLEVTGAAQSFLWKNGVATYNWEVGASGANNWTSTDQKYFNLDSVTFDNNGSNASNINLTTTLNPASVTFTNNSGHNYTFAGSGAIVGSSIPLNLNGSGNATFSNSAANTFGDVAVSVAGTLTFSNGGGNTLGNVTVGSGNLSLGNSGANTLGSVTVGAGTLNLANGANANTLGNVSINGGAMSVTNGADNTFGSLALNTGTLTFNPSADMNLTSGPITGAGSIQMQGSHVLTLPSNTSAFTGSVAISSGATLKLTGSAAFTAAGSITVASGATLELVKADVGTTSMPVYVGGAGVGGLGAVMDNATFTGTGDTTGTLHNIVLTSDTTISNTNPSGVWAFGMGTVHGALSPTNLPGSLQGNNFTLTKIGVGEIDIENVGDTHLSNINIFGGWLDFQYDATLGSNPGIVTINDTTLGSDDSKLGFDRTPAIHSKPIVIGANGGEVLSYARTTEMISPITTTASTGNLRFSTVGASAVLYERGPITGPGGLTVYTNSPTGKIYVSNDGNSFSGDIVVKSGNLIIGEGGTTGSLGPDPSIELQGGVLGWNLNKAYTVAKTYSGAGGVNFGENNNVQLPNAVVTVNLDSTYSGPTNIYQGKVILKSNNGFGADSGGVFGTVSVLSTWNSTAGGQLDLDGSASNLTIPQNFTTQGSGGYGGFSYSGNGIIRNVAGTNKIMGNLGLAGDIPSLIVAAGGSLEFSNTSTISNTSTASQTLVLGGTAPGLISGSIQDGTSGRTRIEKVGAGTWTISGSATNYGTTDIYEGTLALKDSASLYSAAITLDKPTAVFDVTALTAGSFVVGGAGTSQVLQGTGTVKGNVAFYPYSSGLLISTGGPAVVTYPTAPTTQYVNAPSGPMAIQGTLDLGLGGNTLQFSLANSTGSSANGKIAVTGALTKSSSDTNVLIVPNTSLAAGTYTLLTASSGVNNTTGFALDANHNTRYNLSLAATATNLNLVVSGSNANLSWTGATSADWDVKTTANWSGDGLFYQADDVTFGDGPTTTAVNVAAAVRPASITVNSSSDYSFSGTSGWITGGTGLPKSGSGTLTISTANDFTGTVTVAGGTLKIDNAAALGNASNGGVFANAGTLVDGGTLDLNGQNVSPESISIQSNGAIVNNGTANSYLKYVSLNGDATFGGSRFWQIVSGNSSPGFTMPYLTGNGHTLTKVGANTVSLVDMGATGLGNINVTAGNLTVQGTTTLGNAANAVALDGGSLTLSTTVATSYAKGLNVGTGNGTINNAAGSNTLTGAGVLTGTLTTAVSPGTTLTLGEALSGAGGLTKSLTGTLVVSAGNSYSGPTLISAGTLELTATGQIDQASLITNNAQLQIDADPHSLGTITMTADSSGKMSVLGSSVVTAVSISQGTLTIGVAPASTAVPEPGMWSLLLIGLVALATWRRLQNR
jgi:fibronectin-binding autotransporter adhesin